MSLRQSPRRTPERLAAQRENALHSTGPRTPAGKERARLNALKHGGYAARGPDRNTMLALGEDPGEFERLHRSLLAAYGAGDTLWAKQVEDLVKLYWRRARLDRARDGMLRRELAGVKSEAERHKQERKQAAFAPSERLVLEIALPRFGDGQARLKQILSCLEMLREQVGRRDFFPRQRAVLRGLYGEVRSWQTAALLELLGWFARPDEYPRPPGEGEYGRLRSLLEEEMGSVRKAIALAKREEAETFSASRDACLAPTGKEWMLFLRQENALDRAIDRKVRILMSLREQGAKGRTAEPPSRPEDGGLEHENQERNDAGSCPGLIVNGNGRDGSNRSNFKNAGTKLESP
jgi:hypothetical protein